MLVDKQCGFIYLQLQAKNLTHFYYILQGLVKGVELCLNPLNTFWLAGEVSWLAVEVLSPS